MPLQADLERLMRNLRVSLPGAIDGAIQLEVFNVLNDFFRETNAWIEDVEFTTTADETTYNVVPSGFSAISRLMCVLNEDKTRTLDATMEYPGEIVLSVTPQVAETLYARLALTVTDPTDRDGYPVFPSWVLNKHADTIQSGVLARMLLQPAKPYTNAQLATVHGRFYASGRASARVEARRKNTFGTQTWRFPQTFMTRRRGY